MENLIFENKCAKVYYIPELRLGKVVWDGAPNSEEYKQPFRTLLEFSKNNPVINFLSDTTKQGVVSPENRKWFEMEMMPAALKAGLKRGSVVMDANIFKQYYINMILKASNKFGMPMKVFSKEEDALVWIKQFEDVKVNA
jgi:hypothetical protein